jgi:hypothetical protein
MTLLNATNLQKKEALQAAFHAISQNNQITLEEKREMLTKFMENNFFLHPNLANFLTDRTLTSKGIEYILQKKARKHPYAATIKVCEFVEDFFQECQVLEKEHTFTAPFIIHNQTKCDPNAHFTPIYIQKNEQETYILISDSLGVAYHPNLYISMQLHNIFPNAKQYILMPHRQFDKNSCRIFSIKDSVFFARHPNIFSQLQNPLSQDPNCFGLPESFVKLPPPLMMTCTQSAKVKTTYLSEASQAYAPTELHLLETKWKKYLAPLNASGKIANGRALHFLYRPQFCKHEIAFIF